MFELDIDGGCDVILSISQKSREIQVPRTTIIVAKYEKASKGYEYKYVNSSSSNNWPDHYLTLRKPQRGKYVVYVKCSWIKVNPQKAAFGAYG